MIMTHTLAYSHQVKWCVYRAAQTLHTGISFSSQVKTNEPILFDLQNKVRYITIYRVKFHQNLSSSF